MYFIVAKHFKVYMIGGMGHNERNIRLVLSIMVKIYISVAEISLRILKKKYLKGGQDLPLAFHQA